MLVAKRQRDNAVEHAQVARPASDGPSFAYTRNVGAGRDVNVTWAPSVFRFKVMCF